MRRTGGRGSSGRLRPGRAAVAASAGALVLALVATALLLGARRGPARFLLGGIQVNEADHRRWVETLATHDLNTVAVTVYAKQGNWDDDHLWWEDEEPAVVAEIRAAKRAGLEVVLVLRVALDHAFEENRFLWHGMIMPESDEELASWFAQYGRFARRWAALAEAEGVDLVGIASELSALTSTRPLLALPGLEAYYLDAGKQAEYRAAVLAAADRLAGWQPHRDGENFPSLAAYLDAESAANRAWAEQVTGLTAHLGATAAAADTGADAGTEVAAETAATESARRRDEEAAALDRLNRRRRLLSVHWRRLIGELGAVYSGPLTYAANFDQYREVGFWDELDVVGINAYFPLRPPDAPADELYPLLVAGWRRVLTEIEGFQADRGLEELPVVFTEIGFTARAESTVHPWAGSGFSLVEAEGGRRLMLWSARSPSTAERAQALAALAEVHHRRGGRPLAGLLYWKLSTEPAHREVEPFVIIVGASSSDPALGALGRFVTRPGRERLERRLAAAAYAFERRLAGP